MFFSGYLLTPLNGELQSFSPDLFTERAWSRDGESSSEISDSLNITCVGGVVGLWGWGE